MPFREGAPDMRQSDQPKDHAGGYDIGLHRNRPLRNKTLARWTNDVNREGANAEQADLAVELAANIVLSASIVTNTRPTAERALSRSALEPFSLG